MTKNTQPIISIIIVHYNVFSELLYCIKSIKDQKIEIPYEIIVVDNDERKNIKNKLLKINPEVIYVPNKNKGFGQANNVGTKRANGKYLFFLNPDTKLLNNTVDILYKFISKTKTSTIVAPLLYDNNKNIFTKQGSLLLTPFRQLMTFSFLSKLIPNNIYANQYWIAHRSHKRINKVEIIPGTAFMISKEFYIQIGGFDEKYFLYFEEFDFCLRAKQLGGEAYIHPSAKVQHAWGKSTVQRSDINTIFTQSRFYYFKKNFGSLQAILVEIFMRFTKNIAFVTCALLIALFLSSYKLDKFMYFIGDHGWFYLSARDMLLTGHVPLLGIPSSHPWLHQGALWTYILAGALKVFAFNPLAGAYLTILFNLLAIITIYKISKIIYSPVVAVIASLLYATSPLIIVTARIPYHTSPIPFFALLFIYAILKWMQGKPIYFPISIFLLALLYNLELATFLLSLVLVCLCIYGYIKKRTWIKDILNKKIVLYTMIAFFVPMIPMFAYDINHKFPQTLQFLLWGIYKVAVLLGYPAIHPENSSPNIGTITLFLKHSYDKLIFPMNFTIADIIGICSIGYFIYYFYKQTIQKKDNDGHILLTLIFFVSIIGIFATRTISDAYLPILYPVAIIITSLLFGSLYKIKYFKYYIMVSICLFAFANSYSLLVSNYYSTKGYYFTDRVAAVKNMISDSKGSNIIIKGKGQSSNFESFTSNYEYLAWWLGYRVKKSTSEKVYYIEELPAGIKISTHK